MRMRDSVAYVAVAAAALARLQQASRWHLKVQRANVQGSRLEILVARASLYREIGASYTEKVLLSSPRLSRRYPAVNQR